MCGLHRLVAAIAVLIGAAGCQPSAPAPSPLPVTKEGPTKPDAPANDPKQIARIAREEMFKALSAKLLEAISQGGPVAAIEVCSKDAPKIADRIGQQFGVKIGRTSFKLRNSNNAPPGWVKPLIDGRPTEPRFVDLPENHTGALFPITLKAQCLVCHGPKDTIPPEVQAQLDRVYPDDQATGFHEDDLRGWFWVDVPQQMLKVTAESFSK
jgi:hypothetical protein